MRTKLVLLTALVALVAAGRRSRATATAAPASIPYVFSGQLTATPANGTVSLTVQGGNRRALRAMLGQPAAQTFATATRPSS